MRLKALAEIYSIQFLVRKSFSVVVRQQAERLIAGRSRVPAAHPGTIQDKQDFQLQIDVLDHQSPDVLSALPDFRQDFYVP